MKGVGMFLLIGGAIFVGACVLSIAVGVGGVLLIMHGSGLSIGLGILLLVLAGAFAARTISKFW